MEGNLDQAAASHPDAGYVSLHRLNRVEYARAVKDLLAVEVDPAVLLPQDTKSDGFDNVASVLKVSPTFLISTFPRPAPSPRWRWAARMRPGHRHLPGAPA